VKIFVLAMMDAMEIVDIKLRHSLKTHLLPRNKTTFAHN